MKHKEISLSTFNDRLIITHPNQQWKARYSSVGAVYDCLASTKDEAVEGLKEFMYENGYTII